MPNCKKVFEASLRQEEEPTARAGSSTDPPPPPMPPPPLIPPPPGLELVGLDAQPQPPPPLLPPEAEAAPKRKKANEHKICPYCHELKHPFHPTTCELIPIIEWEKEVRKKQINGMTRQYGTPDTWPPTPYGCPNCADLWYHTPKGCTGHNLACHKRRTRAGQTHLSKIQRVRLDPWIPHPPPGP